MKYNITDLAKKPNEFVFLVAWIDLEDKGLYFEIGMREEWYRHSHRGYTFTGKTTTVCVYAPIYGKFQGLNHEAARRVAVAYVTGDYRRMDINLADRA